MTYPNVHVSVTFRHTESTPALQQYAIEKISSSIGKYFDSEVDAHVVLSVQKRDHMVEVEVKPHRLGNNLISKASTDDLYSAIDKVAGVLSRQLRRQKEKIADQKHQPAPAQ